MLWKFQFDFRFFSRIFGRAILPLKYYKARDTSGPQEVECLKSAAAEYYNFFYKLTNFRRYKLGLPLIILNQSILL